MDGSEGRMHMTGLSGERSQPPGEQKQLSEVGGWNPVRANTI